MTGLSPAGKSSQPAGRAERCAGWGLDEQLPSSARLSVYASPEAAGPSGLDVTRGGNHQPLGLTTTALDGGECGRQLGGRLGPVQDARHGRTAKTSRPPDGLEKEPLEDGQGLRGSPWQLTVDATVGRTSARQRQRFSYLITETHISAATASRRMRSTRPRSCRSLSRWP